MSTTDCYDGHGNLTDFLGVSFVMVTFVIAVTLCVKYFVNWYENREVK